MNDINSSLVNKGRHYFKDLGQVSRQIILIKIVIR